MTANDTRTRFAVTFAYQRRSVQVAILIEAENQEQAETEASVLVNFGRKRLDWRVVESKALRGA